ncbi:MAG: Zn-dependent M28 family amino/carboxypeptidase [Salibacteraceae bacterium]|jgi:Zn-dependent M28 family amino/carboxypeptidase
MKIALLPLLFYAFGSFGQTYSPFYASLADACNQDTVNQNLVTFESFGEKQVGSTELENTYDWLYNAYVSYGYTDIQEDQFFASGVSTKNLVVTKTGSVYPNTYVIIDAHYDTKNGPGANDNGTGTVILLELARLLENVETEYSIKFIHFSAEEDGLLGSINYVNDDVISTNMDIRLVFNIDQVGGTAGMTNDIIVCERDESPPVSNNAASATATTELANCIEFYSTLNTEFYFAYGSDYVPFMNNGEVVTGLYEKNESPYSHTSQDLIVNMDLDYLFQVTKGAMGALAHFVIALDEVSLSEFDKSAIKIYPTPSDGNVTIETDHLVGQKANITVFDVSGKIIWSQSISSFGPKEQIQLNNLNAGSYLMTVESEGHIYRRRVVLK